MDKYLDFSQLRTFERNEIDYRIRWRIGGSGIAVLSIHGGQIEPGTSEIADGIAGTEHTLYSLEGLKQSDNIALHITSTAFDEPAALKIICQSEIIISVHGCAGEDALVYLGGLDMELKGRIGKSLRGIGIKVLDGTATNFMGSDLTNICNLCGRGMGVQIEFSRGLRVQMFEDLLQPEKRHPTRAFYRIIHAVRLVLAPFILPVKECVIEGLDH
jgi:phage replication-related protein YjqB (UPF0714/DUF867 family)